MSLKTDGQWHSIIRLHLQRVYKNEDFSLVFINFMSVPRVYSGIHVLFSFLYDKCYRKHDILNNDFPKTNYHDTLLLIWQKDGTSGGLVMRP